MLETRTLESLQNLLEGASTNEERAEWHYEIARHLATQGMFAEAEKHTLISMELDEQSGKPLCLKKNLTLSECARGQARFHEAVMMLKTTVDNPAVHTDEYALAKSHLAICLSLLELGDYQQALEHVDRSKAIAARLESVELKAQSNVKLGIILMELKDEAGGIKAFQDALAGFRELQDETGMAVALMNISNGYITIGDYNRARPFVEEAIRLNEERGATRYLALNHHSMGSIYQGQGRLDDALAYFKMALDASLRHDDKRLTVYTHISMGEVLNETGFKNHDPDRALKHLNEALVTVTAYGSIADEYKVHKALAEHFETRKAWELFAVHYKKYNELQRETINQEARNKAAQLEAALQLERKDKELEVERSRSKEMEARHAQQMADQRLETFTRFALQTAHEVQNPLQFVNNFSELNTDLIADLEDVLKGIDLPDEAREIIADLCANSEKIAMHGKRISAVVSELLHKVNTDKKAA